MLGVMAIPSIIYTLMVFSIPESPRWLLSVKHDKEAAKKIMFRLDITDPDAEIKEIQAAEKEEKANISSSGIFARRYRTIVWLAFFVAFFNQWSGINFILYYAPEILARAGLAAKDSLGNSILIGFTNLAFTFVGLYFIDRIGRKTLLIVGSLGYILSLAMVAWAFYSGAGAGLLLVFLMLFIASHAIGQGAVIWVFIAEIFPTKVRATGQAFGASVHWIFAAVITLITPVFLDAANGIFKDNPWPIFAFFAFMMVLQLLWVLMKVPETKGISLEALEKKLVKQG